MSFSVRLPFAIAFPPPGVGVDDLRRLAGLEMEAKGRRAREGGNDGRREIGDLVEYKAFEGLLNAAGDSGEGAKVVERESKRAVMFGVAEHIAQLGL